jgi:transcriptional regulator with XRE-family HTH domain
MEPVQTAQPVASPGALIRRTRRALGLTQGQLGARTGYSAAQVSRYERGISPLTDITVLRRFARALDIPPHDLGLTPGPGPAQPRPAATGSYPELPPPNVEGSPTEDGDGVRRRRLLANLAVTAAAAVDAPLFSAIPGSLGEHRLGQVLVDGLRDAMLGLGPTPAALPPEHLAQKLARAAAHFNSASYGSLAVRLPHVIRAGHQAGGSDHYGTLARAYLLATRVLVKLDEPQLAWMAVDRARQLGTACGTHLAVAEAARQQAVLARQAGWHDQSISLALTAAENDGLRELGPSGTAQRGLLIQCAAYTVAHQGDRRDMRELTAEAAAIAATLQGTHIRDSAGGFTPRTVQLHLISAETKAGDPGTAIAAADKLHPQSLPITERRARYFTDRATAYAQWGRRDECIAALLETERCAPEETHARPAVRAMVTGLLMSGRTTPELRGLAARVHALC